MLRRTILGLTVLGLGAGMVASARIAAARSDGPSASGAGADSAHPFVFQAIEGGDLPLSRFSGRPVMVVNTASRCGFTDQYEALQAVWQRYRDRGLVVLAVPSDDFGRQELATEQAVQHFCEVTFGIDFPMAAITRVKGRDAHPFYRWALAQGGQADAPRWNFHKYLLDRDGRYVRAFPTTMRPDHPDVIAAIEVLLGGEA